MVGMNHKKDDKKKAMLEERCQTILLGLLRDVDNRYCVDCDAKGPRWASWSIGIFLCIRCAGIHRNLGVHISRVKSVNLDTWTPEQVVSLQQMGNSRARAVYEALLSDGLRRPQTDSGLESFIRAKYEQKKYIAREWVAQPLPKVNWEQEIEEELENQKRKKKPNQASPMIESSSNTVSPRVSTPVAIPAPLPKAKGTSNSPKLRSEVKRTPSAASSLTNSDLLGLNTSTISSSPANKSNFDSNSSANDSFDNFLSDISSPAPAPQAKDSIIPTVPAVAPNTGMSGNSGVNSLQKEEEDFFNQKALSGQDKNKMTKDSIMALYSMNNAFAAPAFMPPNANNFNMGQQPQHPQQQFANPGQFFQAPATQPPQDQFFAQFNSFQQPHQNGNGNFGNFVQQPFQATFAAPVANSYQMNTQKLNEDNIKKIESLNFNNFK